MPRTPNVQQQAVAPAPQGEAFTKGPNSIVAAAIPVNGTALPRTRKHSESWQREAWDMYDTVGALRYAANWYSNACSKAKMQVGERNEEGDFVPDTEGDAWEALEEVKRSFGGEAELIKALALHDFVAGECYLIGMDSSTVTQRGNKVALNPTEDDVWMVASIEEVDKVGDTWTVTWDDDDKVELAATDTVMRLWTPSPRKRWQADSPVKAALPDLREIHTAGRHISAQMWSRLAGAGVLLLPNEISFTKPANQTVPDGTAADPNVDPLMLTIGTTMAASMDDPGSVASFVPIILKVPGESVDKIKHLNFWSQLDEKAVEIRKDAKQNLATTLDMPAEVILGTADMNHWGAWQVDESSVKTHIEPGLGRLAANMTLGFLRALKGIDPKKVIAFDTSALRLRPNRSKEALELYDRGELNGAALRRETGFEEKDGYGTDPEGFNLWLLKKMAGGSTTPEQVAWAVSILTKDKMKPPADDPNTREERPDPSLEEHPTLGPPNPDDAQTASLVATCEALLYRAMERAGNRMKNRYDFRPVGLKSDEVHTECKAKAEHLSIFLSGAWDALPMMLHRTDYDAEKVAAAMDSYARLLMRTQAKYDPDAMQRHLFRELDI